MEIIGGGFGSAKSPETDVGKEILGGAAEAVPVMTRLLVDTKEFDNDMGLETEMGF